MSIGHMLTWMCTTGCHYRVHSLKNISILQRFKFSNPLIILSNPGMLLTFQYAISPLNWHSQAPPLIPESQNQSLPNPTCQLVPYSLVYYIMHQFSPTLPGGQWWSGQPIRPQLHWTQQCLHGKNSSCDCLQEDLLGWGHCQGCSGVCSSRLSFILSWYHIHSNNSSLLLIQTPPFSNTQVWSCYSIIRTVSCRSAHKNTPRENPQLIQYTCNYSREQSSSNLAVPQGTCTCLDCTLCQSNQSPSSIPRISVAVVIVLLCSSDYVTITLLPIIVVCASVSPPAH